MSFIEKVEQLSKAAEEALMFDEDEVNHPAWELLPRAKDKVEYKEAIKNIFARDVADSPHKDRIVSFYADYALNSLLLCESVRRIERYSSYDYRSYDVPGDSFESWPQFIGRVSKDGHWSEENWRKVVYHYLRDETYYPAQLRALEAEVGGLTQGEKKPGDSVLFNVLVQYHVGSTFYSLMRVEDDIKRNQAEISAKKRKFEKLLSDQEAFMQSVMA